MQKQNFSLASARQCKVNIRQYLESLLLGFPASVLGMVLASETSSQSTLATRVGPVTRGGWQDSNRLLVYAGTRIG